MAQVRRYVALGSWEALMLGLPIVFTDMPVLLGQIMVALGLVGFLVWLATFPKKDVIDYKIPGFLPMWRFQALEWLPFRRLIPMKKAVKVAYKSTLNNLASSVAEDGFEGKLIIESYYATALVNHGNTPIYGYKYGTERFVKIPPKTFKSGGFSDDADKFSYFGKKQPCYVGLAIRNDDLKRMIKKIKSWDGES